MPTLRVLSRIKRNIEEIPKLKKPVMIYEVRSFKMICL